MMKTKLFLLLFIAGSILAAENPAKTELLYFTSEDLRILQERVAADDPGLRPWLERLRILADIAREKGPWSVTEFPSPAVSGNPHDYFSEGPYWWPDPQNPAGPFIRRDGLRYPGRFTAHKDALIKMIQSSTLLSLAGILLDEPAYSDRAAELIRVWFLDPDTRMNPHLNYAQAIRNKSPGRGVGIIETHRFTGFMEALNLLRMSGRWPQEEQQRLAGWLREYLLWLQISPNGRREKMQGNNHTSWWCAQVAAIARYLDQDSTARMVYDYAGEEVIPVQIASNGSMPKELARTRSYDYTRFNLTALSILARLARYDGVNLWTAELPDGRGLVKAIDYFLPYFRGDQPWPFEQILRVKKREPLWLAFAALDLSRPGWLELYRKQVMIPPAEALEGSYDPFIYYVNMMIISGAEQR